MKPTRCVAYAVVALLLLAGAAVADERVNAPTITGETGYFSLFTGETLPRGTWSFGFYYNNWDRVFEFADDADLDWNRLSASVGYGVTENFEISLMLPYESLDPDIPGLAGIDLDEDGLGNARLGGKYQVFGSSQSSFAVNAFVELPTGDEEVLGGDTGFGAGVAWRQQRWVFNLGYRAPGDVDDFEISDEVLAGVGYAGTISEQFDWITELNGTFQVDSDDAIFEDSIDLVGGGRYWLTPEGPWAFNFGLRTDLLQLADTDEHCPIGGLLGFTYFAGGAGRGFRAPAPPPPPPPPVEYQLTVETSGDCAGTVTSVPAGINCGTDCSELYEEGTVVNLQAIPVADCELRNWTGDEDCSDGELVMNGDRACVANFQAVAPPPTAPPPAPKLTEVERTCLFGANSARVDNACKAILDEVALLMRDNPEAPALVIGYSDSVGSEDSNMRMSRKRAEAVKNWLVTRHAVDPSRIEVEARGESDPVASNETAEGRKQNRRAVIRITVEEEM